MDTYRAHTPFGMLMKSEPYASTIASPDGKYDVAEYCGSHGLDYVDRVGPLTRERFLEYANWYTKQLVPGVRDETVTDVSQVDGGFRVSFADAQPITARQVIVATGVLPYQHIPAELAGLPEELVTHVAKHMTWASSRAAGWPWWRRPVGDRDGHVAARGRGGRPAHRPDPALNWSAANPEHLSALGHIKRPVTQLCEGWHCAFWYQPRAFRMLPENVRIVKAKTVLGPNGSWWLKDRVVGVVDVLPGHRIKEAVPHGQWRAPHARGLRQSQADFDHVIAGTGYRVDLARLPFLPQQLRTAIKSLNGHPVVNRNGETSVPGLYFAGAPTVLFIGPSARFIAGTHTLTARSPSRWRGARGQAEECHAGAGSASASPVRAQASGGPGAEGEHRR